MPSAEPVQEPAFIREPTNSEIIAMFMKETLKVLAELD